VTDFTTLPDLASRRLGGGVVYANDEFFAAADNLVTTAPATFEARTFGPKGQIYDGWETRRRRVPGHDFAIVRLGAPGVVHGVVIDTAHFRGNYPPYASVEGCGMEGYPSAAELADAAWQPLVPKVALDGDARNEFAVSTRDRITHVRLCVYPDGGVARLRVHGEVVPDPRLLAAGSVDLAAQEYGGLITGCSDMFYGSPNNLLLPGLAATMGEGWETARRRGGGNDWVLVRLAAPGWITLAELDTTHFKGNAPGEAGLRGIDARTADLADPHAWFEVLPITRLQPDTRHRFVLPSTEPVTHVRLDVYPDGGMGRLRLFGAVSGPDLDALATQWFNSLPEAHARAVLTGVGGLTSARARRLLGGRPVTAVPAEVFSAQSTASI
jgi:allantoicase